MHQKPNFNQYAVLFVDDEKEAREALAEALAEQFNVITASGVDEALAILAQQGGEIGVLLSDQRMPGRAGVDLLTQAREQWPSIVRILTTAYTDYDDAIAAVNRGEILRYIHKPWNIRELRMELVHAMELFMLRREREQLLTEKLSVWQRLLEAGRARDLLVSTAGLYGLRNTAPAVSAFIQQMRGGKLDIDWNRLDYWRLMEQETRRSIAVAVALRELLDGVTLEQPVAVKLADIMTTAAAKVGDVDGLADLTTLPTLQLPVATSVRLLAWLLQEAKSIAPDGAALRVAAKLSGGDVLITIDGADSGGLSATDGFDHTHLLAAFLLSYHLGGTLTVPCRDAQRPLFALSLPVAASEARIADEGCIEQVFAQFEE